MGQQGRTSRGRGFSLIELVIVLVIGATLAAIAAPRFAQAAARQRLQAASDRVVGDLKLAQERARAASKPATVSFDLVDGAYQFDAVGGSARTVQLDDEPYRIKLSSADFNGSDAVSFNMHGIPDQEGSIVLTGGGQTVTIQVKNTGEVMR